MGSGWISISRSPRAASGVRTGIRAAGLAVSTWKRRISCACVAREMPLLIVKVCDYAQITDHYFFFNL